MTTLLYTYFFIGLVVTVIALVQLYGQERERSSLTILKLVLGAVLWPLAFGAYWYSRQQEVARAGPISPSAWMRQKEASGRHQITKNIEVIVRYPPRSKAIWFGHLVLIRPRFTLDAPLLIAPDRIIITTFSSQYHIYKEKR